MKRVLPERPDLEQLKKQAKDLLDNVHAGQSEALVRIDGEDRESIALHDVQRILAREYGFASWPKLKLHIETRTEEAAETRLIQAALDGDKESVRAILAERPALRSRSLYVAVALGDESAAADWLQRAPAAASLKGGPRQWEPLIYLCFGRCGGGDEERAAIARRLLSLGADPNSHWIDPFWPDAPQPVLYGATGVNDRPQLARLLLAAGADPNDGESRYHAAENYHRASLEVLREFGADFSGCHGCWGNTPLYFLLGWYKPSQAVRAGIRWLLDHGVDPNVRSYTDKIDETPLHLAVRNGWEHEIVALLLDHGADPRARRGDGRTAYALAVQGGRDDLAALLLARGVVPEAGPVDRFLGACMRADAPVARALLREHPDLLSRLTINEQRVVSEAAKRDLGDAISLMGALGFNLAIPEEHSGETPLHVAAWHGRASAAAALIRAGAPLDLRDKRFDAPPIGWCAHGSQFCKNPEGDYAAVARALIEAGAAVPTDTQGSPEVMAVVRPRLKELKHIKNGPQS